VVTEQLFTLKTVMGWVAVWANVETLLGLSFGHRTEPQALRLLWKKCHFFEMHALGVGRPKSGWQTDLASRLADFAAGRQVEFENVPLELTHLTNFRRRVVEACRRIPFGETVTYSQLAVRAGSPRAARAVGTTMAQNRFPIVVPCHRVVGADGALRGYSAPRGIVLKQRLLSLERRGSSSSRL